jgi:hypothetical protein
VVGSQTRPEVDHALLCAGFQGGTEVELLATHDPLGTPASTISIELMPPCEKRAHALTVPEKTLPLGGHPPVAVTRYGAEHEAPCSEHEQLHDAGAAVGVE